VSLFDDRIPEVNDAPEGEIWPTPSNPMAVARRLIDDDGLRDGDGVLMVRWWRGAFLLWTGARWVEVADRAIKARIYAALEGAQYWKPTNGAPELVPWAPTRHKIADVAEALSAIVHVSERTEAPAWIEGEDQGRILAVKNGLLDLRTRKLFPHTPRLFNLLALPYEFVPNIPYPARWLQFLDQLFPNDQESTDLLQEWFGYILSGATDQHKILLLVGPPRSGKGTIARVLTALVGRENTAGPTLASLGTNFGMSPLLGKAAAIVSDARLGKENAYTVVERLLSISGEDSLTVDRKYREPWTGRLPTRFTVISNELPNLGDASGAVATRFLVLALQESWLGRENPALTAELLEELPGILLWALDGLDRLQLEGRFLEPTTSRDAVTALHDLASPVGAFVREVCVRGAGYEVSCRVLYMRWRAWELDHGKKNPTTEAVFGRDLRAVIPGLKRTRRTAESGSRHWVYEGIDLRGDHNGDDLGPSGTEDAGGDAVPDNPRATPMWSQEKLSIWKCDQCDNTTYSDMTDRPCKCGGTFQEERR
jgi:putative DNA primase/helicase